MASSQEPLPTDNQPEASLLERLHLQKDFDLTLLTKEDQPIRCHAIVASACSDYIENILQKKTKATTPTNTHYNTKYVVNVDDITQDILLKVVEYFYSGCLTISGENAGMLLVALHLLQTPLSATESCLQVIRKHLSLKNYKYYQSMAIEHDIIKLEDLCRDFISDNLLELTRSGEISDIEAHLLIWVLKRDDCRVSCEDDVLQAVLLWLDGNTSNIHEQELSDICTSLLHCVRFEYISSNALRKLLTALPKSFIGNELLLYKQCLIRVFTEMSRKDDLRFRLDSNRRRYFSADDRTILPEQHLNHPVVFHSETHHEDVSQQMYANFMTSNLTDVVITSDAGTPIKCHGCILAASSSYAKDMVAKKKNMKLDCASDDIREILCYMYLGRCTITVDNVEFMLTTSITWNLPYLRHQCVSFVHNDLNMENCVHYHEIACSLDCEQLSQFTYYFIQRHFIPLLDSGQLAVLDLHTVHTLLSNNGDDDTKMRCIIQWLREHSDTQDLSTLISLVNFDKVSIQYMNEIRQHRKTKHIPEIKVQSSLSQQCKESPVIPERASLTSMPTEVLQGSAVLGTEALYELLDHVDCTSEHLPATCLIMKSKNRMISRYEENPQTWKELMAVPTWEDDGTTWCVFDSCIVIAGALSAVNGSHVAVMNLECDRTTCLLDLPMPVHDPGVAVSEDVLYVFGGRDSTHRTVSDCVNSIDLRNPSRWQHQPQLPRAVNAPLVTSSGQFIYIFGGYDGNGLTVHVQIFNRTTRRWKFGPNLPVACDSQIAGCVTKKGQIKVITGSEVMVYDTICDKWTDRKEYCNISAGNFVSVALFHGHIVACVNSGRYKVLRFEEREKPMWVDLGIDVRNISRADHLYHLNKVT